MAILSETWKNLDNWSVISGYPSVQRNKLKPDTNDDFCIKYKTVLNSGLYIKTSITNGYGSYIAIADGQNSHTNPIAKIGIDNKGKILLYRNGYTGTLLSSYDTYKKCDIAIFLSDNNLSIKINVDSNLLYDSQVAVLAYSDCNIYVGAIDNSVVEFGDIIIDHSNTQQYIGNAVSSYNETYIPKEQPYIKIIDRDGLFYNGYDKINIESGGYVDTNEYTLKYDINKIPCPTSNTYSGADDIQGSYTSNSTFSVNAAYVSNSAFNISYSSIAQLQGGVHATLINGDYQTTQQAALSASNSIDIIYTVDGSTPVANKEPAATLICQSHNMVPSTSCVGTDRSVYIGVQNDGIYKLSEGSSTLTKLSPGALDWRASCVAANGDIIFLAYSSGVYRSTDGGSTWNIIADIPSNTTWMSAASDDRGNIILSNGIYVYKSTNNGSTWVDLSLSSTNIKALAITSTHIFAAVYMGYIYKIPISGGSWTNTGISGYWISGSGNSNNSHVAFLEAYNGRVYYSSNNGTSFDWEWASYEGSKGSVLIDPITNDRYNVSNYDTSKNGNWIISGRFKFMVQTGGYLYIIGTDSKVYKFGNILPITNGIKYSSPIYISSSTTIKAVPVDSGMNLGAMSTFSYSASVSGLLAYSSKSLTYSSAIGYIYKDSKLRLTKGNFIEYGNGACTYNDNNLSIDVKSKEHKTLIHKASIIRRSNHYGTGIVKSFMVSFSGDGSACLDVYDYSDAYNIRPYEVNYPRDNCYDKISSSIFYDGKNNKTTLYKVSSLQSDRYKVSKSLLNSGNNTMAITSSDIPNMPPFFVVKNDGKEDVHVSIYDIVTSDQQVHDVNIVPSYQSGTVFGSPSAVSLNTSNNNIHTYINSNNIESMPQVLYTIDGTEPGKSPTSIAYSGGDINIDRSTVLKVTVYDNNGLKSYEGSHIYYVGSSVPFMQPPICKIINDDTTYGIYNAYYSFIKTNNGSIRYTTDGTQPTSASTEYSRPIPINDYTKPIRFISYSAGHVCYEGSANYFDTGTAPGNRNTYDGIYVYDIKDTSAFSGGAYQYGNGAAFSSYGTAKGYKSGKYIGIPTQKHIYSDYGVMYAYTVSGDIHIKSRYNSYSIYSYSAGLAWAATGWNGISSGYVSGAIQSSTVHIKNMAGVVKAYINGYSGILTDILPTRQSYKNDAIEVITGYAGSYVGPVSATTMLATSHSGMNSVISFSRSSTPYVSGGLILCSGGTVGTVCASWNDNLITTSAYETSAMSVLNPKMYTVFGHENGKLPSMRLLYSPTIANEYANHISEWAPTYGAQSCDNDFPTQLDCNVGYQVEDFSTKHNEFTYENVDDHYIGIDNYVITILTDYRIYGNFSMVYGCNKNNALSFYIRKEPTTSNIIRKKSPDTILSGIYNGEPIDIGDFKSTLLPNRYRYAEHEGKYTNIAIRLAKKIDNGITYIRSIVANVYERNVTKYDNVLVDSGWIEYTENTDHPFVKVLAHANYVAADGTQVPTIRELTNISLSECNYIMDNWYSPEYIPTITSSIQNNGVLNTSTVTFSAHASKTCVYPSDITYIVSGPDNGVGKSVSRQITTNTDVYSFNVVTPATIKAVMYTNHYTKVISEIHINDKTEDYLDIVDNDGSVTFKVKGFPQSISGASLILDIDNKPYQIECKNGGTLTKNLSGGRHKIRLRLDYNDYINNPANYNRLANMRTNRQFEEYILDVSHKLNPDFSTVITDKSVVVTPLNTMQGDVIEYKYNNSQYSNMQSHAFGDYGMHRIYVKITRGSVTKETYKDIILKGQSEKVLKSIIPIRSVRVS